MKYTVYDALIAKYTAEHAHARANLSGYINNPSFIGEHGDIVGEAAIWVEKAEAAKAKLDFIKENYKL